MITVEEAKRIVLSHAKAGRTEWRLLDGAMGRMLAEDVKAPYDHPLFDMSAVDGYALGDGAGPWKVIARIAAGEVLDRSLKPGECARIFTGAHVPADSYAVVMQEQCTEVDGMLIINGSVPIQGANIRRKGEGSKSGDLLLLKGTRLNAAGIGLLASCGIQELPLTIGPRVSIVRTGGEFTEGGTIQPGRIFSSNEKMLLAAVRQMGFRTEDDVFTANDNVEDISNALRDAIGHADAVITTGGVSVGEHDLIATVLKMLGATIHFHGVQQKPGKPMLFATLKGVPVFALPGNPRAVWVCFHEYVLPFLDAMDGSTSPGLRIDHVPITHTVTIKGDRAEFRAARVRGGNVELLADEGSHMLGSLVDADALAYFPTRTRVVNAGDPIEVHHLPRR